MPDRFKWNLSDIFPDWEAWEAGYKQLEAGIARYAALKGTLSGGAEMPAERVPPVGGTGPARLSGLVLPVAAVRRRPARQRDQRQAAAGADPVRAVGAGRVMVQPGAADHSARNRPRLDGEQSEALRLYRFAIENLYRQQEHVLDEAGEKLMSLASRLASAPNDAYWALVDGRREVPRRSRCRPASRSPFRTASIARCSPPGGSSRIARRRSARCTKPIARR